MTDQYFIGIDPVTIRQSKGALVTMKRTSQGIEVIKIIKLSNHWFQKLKVKFYLWKMKRFYRNVRVTKETQEGVKTLNKLAKKRQLFDISSNKNTTN